ncbi:MAG: hypothetical protein ACYTEQ_29320, partial [Planctomycetota bacterium]
GHCRMHWLPVGAETWLRRWLSDPKLAWARVSKDFKPGSECNKERTKLSLVRLRRGLAFFHNYTARFREFRPPRSAQAQHSARPVWVV